MNSIAGAEPRVRMSSVCATAVTQLLLSICVSFSVVAASSAATSWSLVELTEGEVVPKDRRTRFVFYLDGRQVRIDELDDLGTIRTSTVINSMWSVKLDPSIRSVTSYSASAKRYVHCDMACIEEDFDSQLKEMGIARLRRQHAVDAAVRFEQASEQSEVNGMPCMEWSLKSGAQLLLEWCVATDASLKDLPSYSSPRVAQFGLRAEEALAYRSKAVLLRWPVYRTFGPALGWPIRIRDFRFGRPRTYEATAPVTGEWGHDWFEPSRNTPVLQAGADPLIRSMVKRGLVRRALPDEIENWLARDGKEQGFAIDGLEDWPYSSRTYVIVRALSSLNGVGYKYAFIVPKNVPHPSVSDSRMLLSSRSTCTWKDECEWPE